MISFNEEATLLSGISVEYIPMLAKHANYFSHLAKKNSKDLFEKLLLGDSKKDVPKLIKRIGNKTENEITQNDIANLTAADLIHLICLIRESTYPDNKEVQFTGVEFLNPNTNKPFFANLQATFDLSKINLRYCYDVLEKNRTYNLGKDAFSLQDVFFMSNDTLMPFMKDEYIYSENAIVSLRLFENAKQKIDSFEFSGEEYETIDQLFEALKLAKTPVKPTTEIMSIYESYTDIPKTYTVELSFKNKKFEVILDKLTQEASKNLGSEDIYARVSACKPRYLKDGKEIFYNIAELPTSIVEALKMEIENQEGDIDLQVNLYNPMNRSESKRTSFISTPNFFFPSVR